MRLEELQDVINKYETTEFAKIIEEYNRHHALKEKNVMRELNLGYIEQKLIANDIVPTCPKCNTTSKYSIVKNGKRAGLQRYKCKNCNVQFSLLSGTMLEKIRYNWDVWVKMLEMTLRHTPITDAVNILEKEYGAVGISPQTVWYWRIKLMYAISEFPLPELTGVIQIDETYIRESQKGMRELVNFASKHEPREPRRGTVASKQGIMGAEFTPIVAAISDSGHSICKALSYAPASYELFDEEFTKHFRSPSYICTDAKYEYLRYCQDKGFNHYVKPSNYMKIIEDNGYLYSHQFGTNDTNEIAKIKKRNQQILERLYKENLIDYIYPQRLTYGDFNNLKTTYELNLSSVNSLHAEIKRYINVNMKNVSSKYINYYLGVFNFVNNFKVDNKGMTPANLEDAEMILIEIIRNRIVKTNDDIKSEEFDLPKPSYRSQRILAEKTEIARKVTGNVYFKFDTADGLPSFDKRKYLESLPLYRLKEIAKPLKIKGYTSKDMTKWKLTRLIEKHPDAESEIFKYIHNNQTNQIPEEDMKVINSRKFSY